MTMSTRFNSEFNRFSRNGADTRSSHRALPDKENFFLDGIYLDAAYTHPIGLPAIRAGQEYLASRACDLARKWPGQNARNDAVGKFATLINASPLEIAVVPSTVGGENLLAAALGLGAGKGVLTDAFHYGASLVMYGELSKQGMPLVVLAPTENRIDYRELEAAITPDIKLVAVSLVASGTGYLHDLKQICEIAHRKGAYVFADVVQAVGAIPFDVKESGVDFCCAGHYKWLMGEFGAAFLYIRADRLPELKRTQWGWHGYHSYKKHYRPYDSPGPMTGSWTLGINTANIFEVSTDNWFALSSVSASLDYILDIGVDRLNAHRLPLLEKLQHELPALGFKALTPKESQGPYVVFSFKNAQALFSERLKQAGIFLTLDEHILRIAPSLYNDLKQIEQLIEVLASAIEEADMGITI